MFKIKYLYTTGVGVHDQKRKSEKGHVLFRYLRSVERLIDKRSRAFPLPPYLVAILTILPNKKEVLNK